ncbi:MAG TPA: GAF domain-containing protein [Kineosporiaceae bacterium]|nr:GAF domain-containing protein [Kineosporiaceae bacterium]
MTSPFRTGSPDSNTSISSDTEHGLAVMRKYAALEAPQDGAFDRIARIAATTFATPIGTVTIVDEDRVWFAATQGLDGVRNVGTEPGLCASVVQQTGPYVVNDAATDPRTQDHPLVRGELGLRFYAASPIVTSSGHALGTVNVIDQVPRDATAVGGSQIAVLTDLAGTVADQLEIKLAALDAVRSERLMRAREATRLNAADLLAAQVSDAAKALHSRQRPDSCQLGGPQGCSEPAAVKVADSWGDSAWGCAVHSEEVLTNVPSVFLAAESTTGLSAYLRRHPPA